MIVVAPLTRPEAATVGHSVGQNHCSRWLIGRGADRENVRRTRFYKVSDQNKLGLNVIRLSSVEGDLVEDKPPMYSHHTCWPTISTEVGVQLTRDASDPRKYRVFNAVFHRTAMVRNLQVVDR
jgi:hypothetical protein